MAEIASKPCVSCGREIVWRKKWERSWAEVRYCSTACRRRGVSDLDRHLEDLLRRALAQRRAPSLVSDVAASVDARHAGDDLREPLRRAARRLVASGEAEIVQGGRVVDPSTARGPIFIRRRDAQ